MSPVSSHPVLSHLGMGLGLGALGCVLVLAVRGPDEASKAPSAEITVSDAADTQTFDAPIETPIPFDARAAALDATPARPDAAIDAAPPPAPVFRVAQLAADPKLTLIDGQVGRRPFLAALASAGISRAESYKVLHAIEKLRDVNHTNPDDAFKIAKERGSGKVVGFEYVTSPADVWQALPTEGGALEATKLDLHFAVSRVAVFVEVGKDLHASLAAAGLEPEMAARIDDALEGHAELSDIHPGSRLRILATEERMAGAFVRYASLDALEYTPAGAGATPLRVYRFPPEDAKKSPFAPPPRTVVYYDGKGQQPFRGGFRAPVLGARIASRFNPHRMHPILHVVMPHNGVDFAAPPGTPVYAAAAGTVKFAGDSGPCGNMVQIEHTGGLVSSYCHLSRFAPGLHPGDKVEMRQLIGFVGQTGRATGPHLHFAIKRNGIFIDPLGLKLDGVRVVPTAHREAFFAMKADLDKELDAIAVPHAVVDGGAPPPPAALDGGAPASPDGGDETMDTDLGESP